MKKTRSNNPTHTTLKRPQRLQRATHWLTTVNFTGKTLVHAYAKKYHTDLLCSIAELRMLGKDITIEYEQSVKRSVTERIAQSQKRKMQRQQESDFTRQDQDENFAFIAGYTSGGAPFGINWEDLPEEPWGDVPEEPWGDLPEEPWGDLPEEPPADVPAESGEDLSKGPLEDLPGEPGENLPADPMEDLPEDQKQDIF